MYQDDPKYKDSQFELNRGNLQQVFTERQFYTDPDGKIHSIKDLTFDQYQDVNGKHFLKPWDDFKDTLKEIILDNTITTENVAELFKEIEGTKYMGFTDYLGRKMILTKRCLTKTSEDYVTKFQNRHQFFPHVKDVLKIRMRYGHLNIKTAYTKHDTSNFTKMKY